MTALCLLLLLSVAATSAAEPDSIVTPKCGEGQEVFEGKCLTMPVLIKHKLPVNPGRASGRVKLWALIDEKGSVPKVEVLECSKPGWGLEEAAIKAVSKRKYKPAMLDGKPVPINFSIVVDFRR